MSEEFATSLRSYLDRTNVRAIDLERAASLPNATVAKLLQGQRPSVERLGEILQSVPRGEAAILLRSYLIDAVPSAWRTCVTITIADASPVSQHRDKLTGALEHLRAAAAADISFRKWVIQTATLYGYDDTQPAKSPLYAHLTGTEPDTTARVADDPT